MPPHFHSALIGKNIKMLRKKANMSQEALSTADVGLSQSRISQIEKGMAKEFSMTALTQIAKTLSVDLELLSKPTWMVAKAQGISIAEMRSLTTQETQDASFFQASNDHGEPNWHRLIEQLTGVYLAYRQTFDGSGTIRCTAVEFYEFKNRLYLNVLRPNVGQYKETEFHGKLVPGRDSIFTIEESLDPVGEMSFSLFAFHARYSQKTLRGITTSIYTHESTSAGAVKTILIQSDDNYVDACQEADEFCKKDRKGKEQYMNLKSGEIGENIKEFVSSDIQGVGSGVLGVAWDAGKI